jgi:hypothetical protein
MNSVRLSVGHLDHPRPSDQRVAGFGGKFKSPDLKGNAVVVPQVDFSYLSGYKTSFRLANTLACASCGIRSAVQ